MGELLDFLMRRREQTVLYETSPAIVSVIVPCYNEAATVGLVVARVLGLQASLQVNIELVVVDDGSTDDTSAIVAEYPSVRLIRHGRNMGKGAAVRTGLANAAGDVIVIQDADLEYFPEEIPGLVEPILRNQADVVLGSRFVGRRPEGMGSSHLLGNRILSLAASLLFRRCITDVMTGHKAFRMTVLEGLRLERRGFEFETEVVAKALKSGCRLLEVPIRYRYREKGKAKIRWIHGLTSLLTLLEAFLRQEASTTAG